MSEVTATICFGIGLAAIEATKTNFMKSTTSRFALVILLFSVLFYSCSNEDDNNPDEVDFSALIEALTDFIKENARPEKRAELRLVINAGAINEDDDQQGLAHFCEHMCLFYLNLNR